MYSRADVFRFVFYKQQGFYRDCAELHSKLFPTGFDHIGLASILRELGHVSDGDCDKWFDESISMQRRLLDKGKPHSSLALTLFSWADVAKERGRLDDALKLYQQSLEVERKLLGINVDHNDVAVTLYELAEVHCEKGDIIEAERLHRMSFEMRFRLVGPYNGSRQKARALYKLGFRALEKEMFAAAKRLFAECLDFVRRLHGGIKYSMDIAITLQGLAGALLGSNEKNKAELLFHDCLDMWDELLPKEISLMDAMEKSYLSFDLDEYQFLQNFVSLHQRLFTGGCDNLSCAKMLQLVAEKDLKRAAFSDAVELFDESLRMFLRLDDRAVVANHVALSLRGWGCSLLESGKVDEAKEPLQESVNMFRQLRIESGDTFVYRRLSWELLLRLGRWKFNEASRGLLRLCSEVVDDEVAAGLYWQARLLFEEREFSEAGRLYKECLGLCKSMTKILYPLTSMVLRGRADIALEENNMEEAERLCRESLTLIRCQLREDEDMEKVESLCLLARIALAKESFGEGRKICEESLEMAKRIYGTDNIRPEIARILHVEAKIAFKQGRTKEAIDGAGGALEMYRSVFNVDDHPRIVEATSDLIMWKG